LAANIPPVVPEALQQFLRGIPGVKQHKSGLTLEPMARITAQLQGQVVFGGAPFVPHAEGAGNTDLAVGPDEEDHRDPKEDLAVLMRPDPGRLPEEARGGFRHYGVVHDEIAARHAEQGA
jgi:hypothetical protein